MWCLVLLDITADLLLSALYTGLSPRRRRHGEVLAVAGLPLHDAVNVHITRRSFMGAVEGQLLGTVRELCN